MSDTTPVQDSIREINVDSWVIGGKIILARTHERPHDPSSCLASWSDGKGAFFTASNIKSENDVPLSTKPISNASPVQLVHDAGGLNAVWRIGEAFCKVQDRLSRPDTTREHTTLTYLHHTIAPLSFPVPSPLYHFECNNRYYLIVTRLPGETLEKAWPGMDEDSRDFCVDRLVGICKELHLHGGSSKIISGIDGRYLDDRWLIPGPMKVKDHSPASFDRHSSMLGMDCLDLVLHHCDLGPQNIIVDFTRPFDQSTVGIIDWEATGFVPRDWVRTKFCISWALDFDFPGEDIVLSKDWRERVQVKLGQEGYAEVAEAWRAKWREACTVLERQ